MVVPCFNEARRLSVEQFEDFADAHPDVGFVMVDDGSTDDTGTLLERLAEDRPKQFSVVVMERNGGKAEAVRAGMLHAFDLEPIHVGFWDADLATPLEAIPEFVELLDDRSDLEMVFGARVKLLGRSVERKLWRHYTGRVFATAASTMLRLAIYDTQCGAKVFRVSPATRALFAEPFVAGWIFDVEILARFTRARRGTELPRPEAVIYEVPLNHWHDQGGSKRKPSDWPRALWELWKIYRTYLR